MISLRCVTIRPYFVGPTIWNISKNIESNDIKEGWSEPKTYWYRAEIPEFTVVTICGHLRREIQITKVLSYLS